MFGKTITLFRLFDFEVKIDASWIVIAVLIVWSLATGVFPSYYAELSTTQYWWMGSLGALSLFASIIFHELSHSLVARRFGLPMRGITLFIFGGVAEMTEEPPSPKAELFMALAGPAASIGLGTFCLGLIYLAERFTTSTVVIGLLEYLMIINFVLALFNLLPAFPLDGGRALRALLWHWKHNINKATRIASAIGSGFGLLLIFLGIFTFIGGAFVSGAWWFLIGMFVRNAANNSYQRLLIRRGLEGEPIGDFMNTNPITVAAELSIDALVHDYIYRHHHHLFPVVQGDKLVSCVATQQVKEIPRIEWDRHSIQEIARPCSSQNTVQADDDAVRVLSLMYQSGNSRLMVINSQGNLVGIVTLHDLLRFLSLKLDLEDDIHDTRMLEKERFRNP